MNLEIITSAREINQCHKDFTKLMKDNSNGKAKTLEFTSPGGIGQGLTYTYSDNNFWWSNPSYSDTNYQNLFGFDPDFSKPNTILFQANYMKEFDGFKAGAIWAKDSTGEIFLLHSGKMGGGIPGFTIENISSIYSGQKATAYIGDRSGEYFVVCQLTSKRAYSQIIIFASEIKRIKEILKSDATSNNRGKTNKSFLLTNYTPEFWGKRSSYFKEDKVESECDHGIIVDNLKTEIETNYSSLGLCVNNKFVDLGIIKGKKPIAIFEIKTSTGSQVLYTAIGQLLLHSSRFKSNHKKIIVLPNTIDSETVSDIKSLGIETLRYKWQGNKVQFLNMSIIKNAR